MIHPQHSGHLMLQGAQAISNRAYHENTTRISKSGLDLIARSPLHYYAAYLDPKKEPRNETPALILGRAVHLAILEPHLFKEEFALHPGFNMRTNQGKEDYAAWLEKIGPDKTVIDVDVYDTAMRMREAVHKHPAAAELLLTGYAEQSFYWRDQESGAPCKMRADFVTQSRIIVDLKTTENANDDAFGRSAANYRYHVQGAFYTDGMTANGYSPEGFVFIAVEKTKPYAVALYYLDDDSMSAGRTIYHRNLDTYKHCLQTNEWPSYSKEIRPLKLPNYAKNP